MPNTVDGKVCLPSYLTIEDSQKDFWEKEVLRLQSAIPRGCVAVLPCSCTVAGCNFNRERWVTTPNFLACGNCGRAAIPVFRVEKEGGE